MVLRRGRAGRSAYAAGCGLGSRSDDLPGAGVRAARRRDGCAGCARVAGGSGHCCGSWGQEVQAVHARANQPWSSGACARHEVRSGALGCVQGDVVQAAPRGKVVIRDHNPVWVAKVTCPKPPPNAQAEALKVLALAPQKPLDINLLPSKFIDQFNNADKLPTERQYLQGSPIAPATGTGAERCADPLAAAAIPRRATRHRPGEDQPSARDL